jgi:FdhD protein
MTRVELRGAYATVHAPGLDDEVAVEEPLEIRVDGRAVAVTMGTPGNDSELALGFLHGEGLIDSPRRAGPPADLAANTVEVEGPLLREPAARAFYTTSSSGVCGKGALEEVAVSAPRAAPGPTLERALLASLPDRLRQPTFARTGGLHATGLFHARRRAARRARGRRPPQRDGQGHRLGADRGPHPAASQRAARLRPAVVRGR